MRILIILMLSGTLGVLGCDSSSSSNGTGGSGGSAGSGGSGGSGVVMVPEKKASWAYTPNKFSSHGAGDDERGGRVAAEVIKVLQES